MRFETFVALRYLRGKRKNRFISLISIISVAGVSVGVIALIVVLSVMTGFNNALRATIIGNRAHLTIYNPTLDPMLDWERAREKIHNAVPEILASAPFVQIYGVIKNESWRSAHSEPTATILIGVEPKLETAVTDLAENLTNTDGRTNAAGALPREKEVVLGYVLAMNLGVHVGDTVSVLTMAQAKPTPFGMKQSQPVLLKVSGISQAKMNDFDSLYGWVNLETARMLTRREGVDGLHARIADPYQADPIARAVQRDTSFRAFTWYENQLPFFEALRQEKLAMFVILVFIVLVAAFNITSTLIMMVMEKERDIGILRTIGVSGGAVLRLFMIEGLLIGLTGTLIGVVAGTILAANINPVAEFLAGLFGLDLFNSQIYYFDRIPSDVVPGDVAIITAAAVLLSFLSTLYPAWSASRLDPVDALRYE